MKRLSDKKYWDGIYNISSDFKAKGFTDYGKYLLFNNIIPQYIGKTKNKKMIEIGCAPGINLILLSKILGYNAFGIDYSSNGVKLCRNNFKQYGLNSSNIIKADFFSDEFLSLFSNKFDLVYSAGFIEHFNNPSQVVENHIKLLKKGGYLLITIPNIQGINRFLMNFFNKDVLKQHNLNIMKIEKFKDLFDIQKLDILYCDYYGTVNLSFDTKSKTKKIIIKIIYRVHKIINYMLIVTKFRYENPMISPYMIFIGKKII